MSPNKIIFIKIKKALTLYGKMFFCADEFFLATKHRQCLLMKGIQGNVGEKKGKPSQGF